MKSPSSAPSRSSRSSSSTKGLVKVKCSFCGNTFYSTPREAVCRKCNRPANRPMPIPVRLAAVLLPFLGLPYSLWLRAHSPLAGNQGLVASLGGVVIYGVAYLGRTLL